MGERALALLNKLGLTGLFNPWVLLAIVLVLGGTNAFTGIKSYALGRDHERAANAAAIIQGKTDAMERARQAGVIVAKAGVHDTDEQARIRKSLDPVKEYIYVHVPPKDCVLPAYLQRVYDNAGTGDPRYLAADGLDADGAASPVSCLEAASVFIANSETFRKTARQLIDLQGASNALVELYARARP